MVHLKQNMFWVLKSEKKFCLVSVLIEKKLEKPIVGYEYQTA